ASVAVPAPFPAVFPALAYFLLSPPVSWLLRAFPAVWRLPLYLIRSQCPAPAEVPGILPGYASKPCLPLPGLFQWLPLSLSEPSFRHCIFPEPPFLYRSAVFWCPPADPL